MPSRLAQLAALGAYGACAAFIGLFAIVAFISRHTTTGGMMPALSAVTWISLGVVLFALLAVHLVMARQLRALAEGRPTSL